LRSDALYLTDIVEAAEAVAEFVAALRQDHNATAPTQGETLNLFP
jgi:uncharacterized protein with HEPN domain